MSDVKVIVYHSGLGCETGCCGHTVNVGGSRDDIVPEEGTFVFDHSEGEDPRAFAERLVTETYGAEHVADLDWDRCEIVDGDSC